MPRKLLVRAERAGVSLDVSACDVSPTALAEATQTANLMSGIRARPRVVAVGGGLVIEGAGALLGAIGVSGAPGGERDDACAKAGIAAIQQNLDF